MRAVIKGNEAQALQALARRSIAVNYTVTESHGTMIMDVPDSEYDKVAKWFVAEAHDRTPYPAGTLLWYSTIETQTA